MKYAVQTGTRDDLTRTLLQFAEDRSQYGETERSVAARRAASELAGGADSTYFERVCYEVSDDADHYSVMSGSREAVATELREAAEGWEHLGKISMAVEARRALALLDEGASTVRIGHLVYEVTSTT